MTADRPRLLRWWLRAWPFVVVLLGLVVSLTLVGLGREDADPDRGGTADAGAAEPTPAIATDQPTRYLALGDSLAAGYQPGTGDDPDGGYPAKVLAGLRAERPEADVTLVNLGCTGETTESFVAGGRCTYPGGGQLQAALAVLASPGPPVDVITLDIGANDVLGCLSAGGIDDSCATASVASAATALDNSLQQLRSAAPHARIVVLDYYNPLLAAWTTGPDGERLARASTGSLAALNSAIAVAARTSGAEVAHVSTAFSSEDFEVANGQRLPVNVQRVCDLTWMCTQGDIHTNDAGNAVLGEAVLRALDVG